jgi:hypothetical protein
MLSPALPGRCGRALVGPVARRSGETLVAVADAVELLVFQLFQIEQ